MNDAEEVRCITNLSIQCLRAELLLIRRMMSDSTNQLISVRALTPRVRSVEKIIDELHRFTGALA